MVQFDEDKQNEKIEDLKKREEENLVQLLSPKYGIPYVNLAVNPINSDSLRVLKEDEMRASMVAPFNIVNKKISMGLMSPNNPKTKETLNNLVERGYIIDPYLISSQSAEKVWQRLKDLSFSFETQAGSLDISNEEIMTFLNSVKTLEDVRKLISDVLAAKLGYRISRIMEILLAGAISLKASDVHIEPEEQIINVRYRLDGVLTQIIQFDFATYKLLLSRIKLISGMKLNVRETSQDGRFSIKIGEDEIEIRASALPGAYGESLVLRVLNPNSISVPLEDLGMHPRLLDIVLHEISKPNGMLLTTGPTGSGKTTTLYALLKKIKSPETKIITIENPIEYHLPGIVQTQTNTEKGYTFIEGLHSALRQDPDVIMVGEIRDEETADTAINAALTGHLVFSTLHTNNACGTYPRLIDLKVNPKIISSALTLSMAQRLTRKLCEYCKKESVPNEREKGFIKKIFDSIIDKSYTEGIQTEKIWKSVGCDKCSHTGFKGRIGIYEAIVTDKSIEEAINKNPSEREIKKAAAPQNILDMKQDGILKILKGVTSFEELERVVDLESEV